MDRNMDPLRDWNVPFHLGGLIQRSGGRVKAELEWALIRSPG
ncbi:MAG TPA: hypothetical protein VGD64_14705 [Acidisarcina sp.]